MSAPGVECRRFIVAIFSGILPSLIACATTPPVIRPGNVLRVTTTQGDTLYGGLIAVRPETLVLRGVEQDSTRVSRSAIEQVDVDRTRRHWWSGTVATCAVAASGIAMTSWDAWANGWSWRLAPTSFLYAMLGWDCLDTRPRWIPARIEEGRE